MHVLRSNVVNTTFMPMSNAHHGSDQPSKAEIGRRIHVAITPWMDSKVLQILKSLCLVKLRCSDNDVAVDLTRS